MNYDPPVRRRVDWKTMSLKLRDALGGIMRNPNGPGEREWALLQIDRCQQMLDDEAAAPLGRGDAQDKERR